MTNKKIADVDAELEVFKTDAETKFQSLEDRFRYGLADLKAELKADAARQQAESDKRHEQLVKLLTTSGAQNSPAKSSPSVGFVPHTDMFKQPTGTKLVTKQSRVRFDDLGFAYPDNVEKPECSDHKNKRGGGGETVRFGEKGPRFYGNKDRNHDNRMRKLKMPVFEEDKRRIEWIQKIEEDKCEGRGGNPPPAGDNPLVVLISNLDAGNPLHVHNSDNSSSILVPFKL
ncbi:hypothetical protein Tco_1260137, partial [Tanacetum coccineum]